MTRQSSIARRALGFALAASVIAAPASARADGQWELGGFIGGHFFSDTNKLGRVHDGDLVATYNAATKTYGSAPQNSELGLGHMAIFGLRLGYYFIPRLGLEGEIGFIPSSTNGGSTFASISAPVLTYRGSLVLHILTGRVRPFILAGGGAMTVMPSNPGALPQGTDTDPMFHAGVGLKVDVDKARHWGLRLDGRVYFPPDSTRKLVTEDYEVTLGVYGLFPWKAEAEKPADSDGDGVPDAKDKCPKEAGLASNDGCPVVDKDGDGVPDAEDKCPAEVGPKENGGCPDKDGDGDGVIDRLDKCPAEVGPKDNDGCPLKDSDGDGLVDRDDKCPDKAGPKENGGCPDVDSDKDGVVDRLDQCKDVAGPAENDGCPIPEKLKAFTGAIEGIAFETGSAVILKRSYKLLDKAVEVLKEFKDEKLEISGHTDDKGDHDKNVKLSLERAEAVKKYLVDKGIEAARLEARGYGPDKPIADNKTPEGRARNRRVEFHLVAENAQAK